MLLLSMGLTWGTFCSKDWMLMSGTRMTVPVTGRGRGAMSFSMAMMETYSVPWAPETRARILPGLAPFTTTTGMVVAASTPAGTSRVPADFSPAAAEAVPTVKRDWARARNGIRNMNATIQGRLRMGRLREDCENSAGETSEAMQSCKNKKT